MAPSFFLFGQRRDGNKMTEETSKHPSFKPKAAAPGRCGELKIKAVVESYPACGANCREPLVLAEFLRYESRVRKERLPSPRSKLTTSR